MSKILKCHPGIGDKTEGIVLCAKDNFSARYDLDRVKGLFSRPQHKLFGKSYKNKILVLNESKGGVASAWMLYEMKVRDMVPKAILFNKANTILAQGAALANLTMCDRFIDGDITSLLKTGDKVIINPSEGYVEVS
jgi:predicted aconitase with swiveling domain